MSKIKKQIISQKNINEDSLDILLDMLRKQYTEIPEKKIKVVIELTANELRRAYVLGMISAELVAKYDMHGCIKTTITYIMENSNIYNVIIEDEYS